MVDKKALPVAIGAHIVRPPYESAYLDSFKLSCQRDQPGGKIPPVDRVNGAFELPVPGGIQLQNAVRNKAHGNFRVRQRNALDIGADRHCLGRIALQELAPRRDIREQMLDYDRRSVSAAELADAEQCPAPHLQHGTDVILAALGHDTHIRHGRNSRQRLAAETQRYNPVQIGGVPYFAGRVASDCHRQILGGHPAAVIRNAHQADAAALYLDRNMPGKNLYIAH